jgi:hypothetical protein
MLVPQPRPRNIKTRALVVGPIGGKFNIFWVLEHRSHPRAGFDSIIRDLMGALPRMLGPRQGVWVFGNLFLFAAAVHRARAGVRAPIRPHTTRIQNHVPLSLADHEIEASVNRLKAGAAGRSAPSPAAGRPSGRTCQWT